MYVTEADEIAEILRADYAQAQLNNGLEAVLVWVTERVDDSLNMRLEIAESLISFANRKARRKKSTRKQEVNAKCKQNK